jgi:hypothetical protein
MKADVIKASILAVLAASLLGATTYFASQQVVKEEPRQAVTLDAFTLKGGQGLTMVSSPFLYDQNISIYALVKDEANNPLTNISISLQINGPPNPYHNVTIEKTIATNASGIAMANLDAPLNQTYPETVIGVWSVVATAQIEDGEQIVDTFVFEVESPVPYVDLYTDRGGQGANVQSQPYKPGENVTLYALVSDGVNPMSYTSVTFVAFNPSSAIAPVIARGSLSDASGIASIPFRLSFEPTVSEGTWQVLTTVTIKDKSYTDTLVFECSQTNP